MNKLTFAGVYEENLAQAHKPFEITPALPMPTHFSGYFSLM